MPNERVKSALRDLDAADRALLDLSLNRGFSDAWIADLLGEDDEATIGRLRERALDSIAVAAGISGPGTRSRVELELKTATSEEWLGKADRAEEPASPRRTIGWPVVAAVAAIVVAVAVLASDDGNEPAADQAAESASAPAPEPQPQPSPDPPARPAPVELARLPGSPRKGRVLARARRSDGATTVTVILRGLPRPGGRYGLWLYDSLIDSVALGQAGRGTAQINARLPTDASRYSFLDLSLQRGPRDPDRAAGSRRGRPRAPRHSGISLFRVPLRELLAD